MRYLRRYATSAYYCVSTVGRDSFINNIPMSKHISVFVGETGTLACTNLVTSILLSSGDELGAAPALGYWYTAL